MEKRELVALRNLSSWCLEMVEWLFRLVPWGCLRFVIVVFPGHNRLLFLKEVTRNDVYETLCPQSLACQEGWYITRVIILCRLT